MQHVILNKPIHEVDRTCQYLVSILVGLKGKTGSCAKQDLISGMLQDRIALLKSDKIEVEV